MGNAPTMKNGADVHSMTTEDWQRLRTKTNAAITVAASTDSASQPIARNRLANVADPLASAVRQKLKLPREVVATAYGIPLAVLRAREDSVSAPSEAELAHLRLIEREPRAGQARVGVMLAIR